MELKTILEMWQSDLRSFGILYKYHKGIQKCLKSLEKEIKHLLKLITRVHLETTK